MSQHFGCRTSLFKGNVLSLVAIVHQYLQLNIYRGRGEYVQHFVTMRLRLMGKVEQKHFHN